MRYLLLFCIAVFLVGCDHFPGSNARSEFPAQVKITISYSDGEVFSHDWPPCRVLGLGAVGVGRLGVKPKEEVSIDLVIIESEGKIIHRFDKAMIKSLIEEEKNAGNYFIWVIDESGIHFSTDEECSRSNYDNHRNLNS